MKQLIIAVALLAAACTGPAPRGYVHVTAIMPSAEALEPYTRAGIDQDPNLTPVQKTVLSQEVTIFMDTLRAAEAEPLPAPVPEPE